MVITLQIQYPIQKDLMKVEAVCCVAVRGTTTRGAYDQPFATGTILIAATTSDFELPGIFDYTLYPKTFTPLKKHPV
jgi:hypothetical protein